MHKLRYLLVLTLFCVAGMVTTSVVAQDNDANQQSAPPQHWRGHGQFDPAKRTEMLTKQLSLTSDQQPKVLDALKSEQCSLSDRIAAVAAMGADMPKAMFCLPSRPIPVVMIDGTSDPIVPL